MGETEKISKGERILNEQGHQVERRFHFGKARWEIDGYLLAEPEEIEHIADGVYSFAEFVELRVKRQDDENRKFAGSE